ncbi:MAG: carbamoyltransferase, partial [Actinobacteria bacterium]|nr:carbamoyltransferase [Actinomycetota bacterium]
VEKALSETGAADRYAVTRHADINAEVARLLASGGIVARFRGRMEFGARALGNRSILAHPCNPDVIRIINEQVKNRDFWMPFAPSILTECHLPARTSAPPCIPTTSPCVPRW